MMGQILGAGKILGEVRQATEIFAGNRAEREAADSRQMLAALEQYGLEYSQGPTGWFDSFMNGLNRLPRPLLVIGTLGLFTYSMIAPDGFAVRMRGLALVPEPLWWLLGAIVSFYFGARELHYSRTSAKPKLTAVATRQTDGTVETVALRETAPASASDASGPDYNAAVVEWRAQQE